MYLRLNYKTGAKLLLQIVCERQFQIPKQIVFKCPKFKSKQFHDIAAVGRLNCLVSHHTSATLSGGTLVFYSRIANISSR